MYVEHQFDCPTCGLARPAETPPCADGHGAECPDRACTVCGSALVVDPVLPHEHIESVRRAA